MWNVSWNIFLPDQMLKFDFNLNPFEINEILESLERTYLHPQPSKLLVCELQKTLARLMDDFVRASCEFSEHLPKPQKVLIEFNKRFCRFYPHYLSILIRNAHVIYIAFRDHDLDTSKSSIQYRTCVKFVNVYVSRSWSRYINYVRTSNLILG